MWADDVSDWIAGASLVLALCSSVIAVWALVYTRRSVDAAERSAHAAEVTANHESHRRLEERTPQWRLDLQGTGRGAETSYRLTLELLSSEVMDHVEVVSLQPELISFRDNQEGVTSSGGRAESVRPLRPGHRDDAAWMVVVPRPSPGGACRLEITARGGTHSGHGPGRWTQTVDVELPPRPGRVSQARFA